MSIEFLFEELAFFLLLHLLCIHKEIPFQSKGEIFWEQPEP